MVDFFCKMEYTVLDKAYQYAELVEENVKAEL